MHTPSGHSILLFRLFILSVLILAGACAPVAGEWKLAGGWQSAVEQTPPRTGRIRPETSPGWRPYYTGGNLKDIHEGGFVWLRVRLPANGDGNSPGAAGESAFPGSIYFPFALGLREVYLDGRLIKRFGGADDPEGILRPERRFWPIKQLAGILTYFQLRDIFMLMTMPYVLLWPATIGRAALGGDTNSRLFSGGLLLIGLAVLIDSLSDRKIIPLGFPVFHYGMFGFFVCLALIAARVSFAAQRRLESHARELEHTNEAFARFVPRQFLEFIGRDGIVDVRLGDSVEREMTVLFSDIRSFTTLSERMSPKENFRFLNSLLERMGPVIREHGGFIDKYIGDAIMALFPAEPDGALRAALAMQSELRAFNAERGGEPVTMGIGLHHGRLMLGTIGESERMEGTVIADAVNLASRVEGLTKEYGAEIMLTESVAVRLHAPNEFALQPLERVQVRGKRESVNVFSLM